MQNLAEAIHQYVRETRRLESLPCLRERGELLAPFDGWRRDRSFERYAGPGGPRSAARNFHRLMTLAVGQADENQHSKDHCGDAERRRLPVPNLRLPHGEVFAGDHHEAEKPEAKADS